MKLYAHAEQKICSLRIGPSADAGGTYLWGVVATFTHFGAEAELTLLTRGGRDGDRRRPNKGVILAIEVWLAQQGAQFCVFERRHDGRPPMFKRFRVRSLAELAAAGLL